LHTKVKYSGLECGPILAHFVLYFDLVFFCLGWWQAFLFAAIHQALTGLYLGSNFAPNHKGMPILWNEKLPFQYCYRHTLHFVKYSLYL